jgi:hypothetical protein
MRPRACAPSLTTIKFISAPAGVQRDTLNLEIYSIARLVAGGVLPAGWRSSLCNGQRGRSGPTTFLAHGIPLSSTKPCAVPNLLADYLYLWKPPR